MESTNSTKELERALVALDEFRQRVKETAPDKLDIVALEEELREALNTVGNNQRVELLGGYRVLGPRGRDSDAASDGSYLEPRVGYSEHRFGRDGFTSRVIELGLEGRLRHRSLPPGCARRLLPG